MTNRMKNEMEGERKQLIEGLKFQEGVNKRNIESHAGEK